MLSRTHRADALLFVVAFLWGAGFVAQTAAMDHIEPLLFTAIRYAIGTLFLLPFVIRRKALGGEWRAGLILGVVMFAAAALQQIGLVYTSASRGGFITGLYVLIVPIAGLVFGHAIRRGHVIGALLAAAGLYLLSGDLTGNTGKGDLLIMGCAVMWAVHVAMVGHLAPKAEPLRLAMSQFLTVAALAAFATPFFETINLDGIFAAKIAILYSGIFAIGIAFSLQVVAQRDAPPTHAAIIMSLEAPFAAAAGILIQNDRLDLKEWVGCGLMLTGVIASQLLTRKKTQEEQAIAGDPVR